MQDKTEANSEIMSQTGTYLTHLFGNRLDWFNVGGLARHRTRETIAGLWTHYSWRELFIRGGMITTTVLLAAYGGQPENPEDNFSPGKAMLYGSVGFFVTHGLAVLPTVLRRNRIVTEMEQFVKEIIIKLDHFKQNNEDVADLIFKQVNAIKQFDFPALKRGDAAVNLMKKKCLMQRINSELDKLVENKVNDFEAISEFWNQDVKILIDTLQKDTNTLVEPENQPKF